MTGIFKAYDIRGIVPDQITEEIASDIGKAFGSFRNGKIYVGCDARETSESIKRAFIDGLISTGCHVVDVGLVTTPLMIFCSGQYDSCAVSITASHNPKNYNGFKVFDKGAIPFSYETGIGEIENIFKSKNFKVGEGNVEVFNPREDYTTHLIGSLGLAGAKKKIVLDCFNGGGSEINPFVFEKLGLEVLKIRCDGDGNFPESGPDPSKEENLEELKQKVIDVGADLGIAVDGDGDRLSVVDEMGNIIKPQDIFCLLVKNAKQPNLKVVYDILTSNEVSDVIKETGGEPIVSRVGHTYISQKAMKEKAQLSGELSGHYYFPETFYGDDALFAGMKLIQYLMKEGKPLSECLKGLPVYFSNNKRVKVSGDQHQIVGQLVNEFSEKYDSVDTLDGVKVNFDNGWMLFRASNTGPQIVIAYESKNKQEFKKIS